MTGDFDDLDDIADELGLRAERGDVRGGAKRGRVAHGLSPVKGSLKAILARSKNRKQKVSLPSIEIEKPKS